MPKKTEDEPKIVKFPSNLAVDPNMQAPLHVIPIMSIVKEETTSAPLKEPSPIAILNCGVYHASANCIFAHSIKIQMIILSVGSGVIPMMLI